MVAAKEHLVTPFPFEVGKTVIDDRYLIQDLLGEGGMGTCFRVHQMSLERSIVLKVLSPRLHPRFFGPGPDARALLENEAKTLGFLCPGNDSFVQVFDRGSLYISVREGRDCFELDLPYYTMEFLDGFSVQTLLGSRALVAGTDAIPPFLPWGTVLLLCAQIARGLAIAHERRVIHRDLKPDNLYIHTRTDRPPIVKIIDPGVSAREGDPSVLSSGTVRYGAPELLSRRAKIETTSSDMYSLGIVFFEIATLLMPYAGVSKDDFMWAHIYGEPRDIRSIRTDVPPLFAELAASLLNKEPASRPTARHVDAALTGMLEALEDGEAGASAQLAALVALGKAAIRARRRARQGMGPSPSGEPSGQVASAIRSTTFVGTSPNALRGPAGEPASPGHAAAAPALPPAAKSATSESIDTAREAPVPIAGVAALVIGEPIIRDKTLDTEPSLAEWFDRSVEESAGVAQPRRTIDGAPEMAVRRSMGAMFDAIWEDDTRYLSSPFHKPEPSVGASSLPARGGSASLSGVQVVERIALSEPAPVVALAKRRAFTPLIVAFFGVTCIAATAVVTFRVVKERTSSPIPAISISTPAAAPTGTGRTSALISLPIADPSSTPAGVDGHPSSGSELLPATSNVALPATASQPAHGSRTKTAASVVRPSTHIPLSPCSEPFCGDGGSGATGRYLPDSGAADLLKELKPYRLDNDPVRPASSARTPEPLFHEVYDTP
jgi:hypothetical protein